MDVHSISTKCARTEFVGTAVLDTIGLVISGVDDTLLKEMNIGTRYHTLGLFSSRTGAAGQITAVDDAVKATGTEVLSIEFPRDTKGWGGHGNYIVIGGNDVSDVRHAISLALELTNKYCRRIIYQRIRSFGVCFFQPMQAVLLPWPFTQFQGKLSDSWQVLRQRLDL